MRSIVIFLLFLLTVLPLVSVAQPESTNKVALLASRKQSQLRRADLIRNEKNELRLSTYIFDLDEFGKETLGLLVDARKRGVKVFLNIDGWTKDVTKNNAILYALESLGVEVRVFNPLSSRGLSFNYRNHMKALIGSDSIIVGGRNMTGDYFKRNSEINYIDMDVHVRGDQVKVARDNFDSVFGSHHAKRPSGIFVKPKLVKEYEKKLLQWAEKAIKVSSYRANNLYREGSKSVNVSYATYTADSPNALFGKKPDGVHSKIVEMIRRAKNDLEMTNPYVLLTPETKLELEEAIKRGVRVQINTNSSVTQDSKFAGMAWDAQKHDLVKMGIEVNELKQGHYIHAKTIVRDGKELFVGSFNLDPRSQNLNLENGFFFKNKYLAKLVSNHNRRIVKLFMVKVEVANLKKMTTMMRTGHCIRHSLRKAISAAIYPIL